MDLESKASKLIYDEMGRQDIKWGKRYTQHDSIWLTILVEEVGEAAECILQNEKTIYDLESEVTQVAAVAQQWLMAILDSKRHFGFEEHE